MARIRGQNPASNNKPSNSTTTKTNLSQTNGSGNGASNAQSKSKTNNKNNDTNSTHSSSTSSVGTKSKATHIKPNSPFTFHKPILDKWKSLIGCVCLAIASYFGYLGYLETRVNTPFDHLKMVLHGGLDDPERYWGTYRPQTYFGLKTRDPHSLVMGLMWYIPSNLGHGGKGIRHWCEMNDNLDKFGWIYHDGRTFGVQEIHDLPLEIKTSFIKQVGTNKFGGDWTARISVRNTSKAWDRTISLIWYVALDERTNGEIKYQSDKNSPEAGVYGETLGLGKFQLRFQPIKGRIVRKSYLSCVAPSLAKIKDTVFMHLRVFPDNDGGRFIALPGRMVSQNGGPAADPNFIAIQITAEVDFSMDIIYQSLSGYSINDEIPKPIAGREYTSLLQNKINDFKLRFESTFHLTEKGYSNEEIRFAQHALSNMLGGIGYFYGSSRVQSIHTKNPVPYWKAPLYTAVPSRSFFPRGFLWDEGFHGLLLSSWDLDIELDIMCHWFDLINVEGWIPREQILGSEALAKVPEEFVIQHNTNANPPTFLLTLKKILSHHRNELSTNGRLATLERLYPRLQGWFSWFNSTQKGEMLGTYYWRGRDALSDRELNPKTLSSGLDDFPRASHPTPRERHLDLRCWIGFAAKVLSELSSILGKDDVRYYETASYLSDNQLLNEHHLSPFTETYADWGLHTDFAILKRPQITQKNRKKHQKQQQQQLEMVRVTINDPIYKFVDSTFGYVNLFPFMLEQLDHDSPYLTKILKDIYDPSMLWTRYGLRSLSKSSPLYNKRNTEHDPPYWRGPIWININYLVLKALRHYGTIEGPNAALARQIYGELRENVVGNVIKEYQRTGYVYEQYDDTIGHGKGCYPFTGWSALTVLMMAEQF